MLRSVPLAAILLAFSNVVNAVPLTWYLNATFSDSASATGYYVFDADTGIYSDWNITTTSGDLAGITYNPGNSYEYYGGIAYLFAFNDLQFPSNYYFNANLLDSMTNAGGMINVSYIQECGPDCSTTRYSTYGVVTTDRIETPEPTTLALLGIGLLGLGYSRRKRV